MLVEDKLERKKKKKEPLESKRMGFKTPQGASSQKNQLLLFTATCSHRAFEKFIKANLVKIRASMGY